MLAIRVGRDNYNCCIKSSDKQLIWSGQQEFNPVLNDVSIYMSVFGIRPRRGEKRRYLSSRQKRRECVEVPFVISFFSPIYICEADLLFIDSHFHFHKFSCSLQLTSFGLLVDENLKATLWVTFFFFQSVLTNRGANESYSQFLFKPLCSKGLAHACPLVNLKCRPSSRTQVAFSCVKSQFQHFLSRCWQML